MTAVAYSSSYRLVSYSNSLPPPAQAVVSSLQQSVRSVDTKYPGTPFGANIQERVDLSSGIELQYPRIPLIKMRDSITAMRQNTS